MQGIDWNNVVFLDETGCNVQLAREHGWALSGQSVCDYVPGQRGANISVVGAIRRDRVLCYEVMNGALNTEKWRHFVQTKLAPRLYPGDILILDNLAVHKDPTAIEWIEQAGAMVLFQPPYSPDLNPIELCWAFMKRFLRKLGVREVRALPSAIRRAFMRVTSPLLEAWFQHCCRPQPE